MGFNLLEKKESCYRTGFISGFFPCIFPELENWRVNPGKRILSKNFLIL